FMLETIRDYAREQLERAGATDDLRQRHAQWYAAWLDRRANERLRGTLIADWEPEEEERDNIRTALAWARGREEVELELQFAASAGLFYRPIHGQLTEGRRWLDDVLARSHGSDEGLRARALVAAAQHAWRQGDYDACEQLAAEAQAVLARLDDRPPLAAALMTRGIAAEARGDLDAEETYYDAAEHIFRELGHTDALNAILNNRGYADLVAGNFQSAERRLREVAEKSSGDAVRFATANHGLALALLGRLDDAEARFVGVLRDAVVTHGASAGGRYSCEGLALVAGSRAEDLRAAQLWGVSAAIRDATGYVLATAEQRFHDELLPEVRRRLGDADFDAAWTNGRQFSFE